MIREVWKSAKEGKKEEEENSEHVSVDSNPSEYVSETTRSEVEYESVLVLATKCRESENIWKIKDRTEMLLRWIVEDSKTMRKEIDSSWTVVPQGVRNDTNFCYTRVRDRSLWLQRSREFLMSPHFASAGNVMVVGWCSNTMPAFYLDRFAVHCILRNCPSFNLADVKRDLAREGLEVSAEYGRLSWTKASGTKKEDFVFKVTCLVTRRNLHREYKRRNENSTEVRCEVDMEQYEAFASVARRAPKCALELKYNTDRSATVWHECTERLRCPTRPDYLWLDKHIAKGQHVLSVEEFISWSLHRHDENKGWMLSA